MKKLICVMLSFIIVASVFSACSKQSNVERTEDLRITSYIIGDRILENFDDSHMTQVTDAILFGCASFDEEGIISEADYLQKALSILRKSNENVNIYLNLLGPSNQSGSDDWKEQMNDLSERHTNSFNSGNLEQSIKNILEKYSFDGVFFDYEYPLKSKYWKAFDSFLISLDATLGDDYKIGVALADWNANQSKKAIAVCDFVEVMAYDLWDDNGNHATMEQAEKCINKMLKKGYSREQLDLGVPFYARPTTKDAYWYDYASWADKIDENGLCVDDETGLTFSFNDYDLIQQKTKWAIENGIGGMMVWHYTCDLPADNEKSLFNAVYNAKNEATKQPRFCFWNINIF